MLSELLLYPAQNLVAGPNRFIQVCEGGHSLRLVGSDEFSVAFFSLDSLFDGGEVLFILEVALFDFVKSLLFGLVVVVGLPIEEITIALHLLEQPQAHLQVVHLKLYQIVNQHFVEVVWEFEAFMDLPELLNDRIR